MSYSTHLLDSLSTISSTSTQTRNFTLATLCISSVLSIKIAYLTLTINLSYLTISTTLRSFHCEVIMRCTITVSVIRYLALDLDVFLIVLFYCLYLISYGRNVYPVEIRIILH